MSERIIDPITGKETIIIKEEAEAICSECKKKKELRPYGKDGALVCYNCAMKDEIEATRQMEIHLFGNVDCTREEAERLMNHKKRLKH